MTRRRHDKRYGSGAWRKLTREIQRRDAWTCQYCGKPSWCADHVIRPDEGGPFFDPANLRAACRSCNTGRRYHGPDWTPPNRRPQLVPARPSSWPATITTDYSRKPRPRIG